MFACIYVYKYMFVCVTLPDEIKMVYTPSPWVLSKSNFFRKSNPDCREPRKTAVSRRFWDISLIAMH